MNDIEVESLEALQAAWNAQADKQNQWDELGLDEIVAFAQRRAIAAEREWARDALIDALGAHMQCPCCGEALNCAEDCTFAADCPDEYAQMEMLRSAVRAIEAS